MRNIIKYVAFCGKIQVKKALIKPFIVIVSLLFSMSLGIIRCFVMKASIGTESVDLLKTTVLYVILTEGLLPLLNIWGFWDISEVIRTGDICIEYTRPKTMFIKFFANFFANSFIQFVIKGIPVIIILSFIFRIDYSICISPVYFIISMCLSIILSAMWMLLLNSFTFWINDYFSYADVSYYAALFGSGMIIPLYLVPNVLGKIISCTPFPYMLSKPIEIFLGQELNPFRVLLIQITYVIILLVISIIFFKKGQKRYINFGG